MSKLTQLNNRDLQILQSALTDLYSDVSQTTLPERTLRFSEKIIPADVVAFDLWEIGGKSKRQSWGNAAVQPTTEQIETLIKYAHENPVFIEVVVKKRPDPVILTDFITTEQFLQTNIYKEFYSFIQAKHLMAIALWISSYLVMTCIFCDSRRNFSERDRLMLSTAAPHLINAVHNASDFDYLTSALEVKNSGVMSVETDGKIQFVSEFVRRIWNKYFENSIADFPADLLSWIKANNLFEITAETAVQPFKIKNTHGELSVRPLLSGIRIASIHLAT